MVPYPQETYRSRPTGGVSSPFAVGEVGDEVVPIEMKVLMNHIYEYEKGVRRMVLYTFNARYADYAVRRLTHRHINYILQPAGRGTVNLFFGRKECLDAIRIIATKPLNELSPEEDFMLGAMLGYDITMECERYCTLKGRQCSCNDCPNIYYK